MWCIIGITVALVVGYFLAAMMFTSKNNDSYEAEQQGTMMYDWSRDEYRWKPYDKPTVIRLKQKENDDGNRS